MSRHLSSETVPLILHAIDSSGAPLLGQVDFVVAIRRISDLKSFNFSTLGWQTTGGANETQALAEIGSGAYYFNLDLSTMLNMPATDTLLHIYTETGSDLLLAPIGELVINPPLERNIIDIIESQRGEHTAQGDTWYVSPNDGNDSNGGGRFAPFATIQAAHDAAGDGTHDVIILLADLGSGVTVASTAAAITISKRYLFIRGPGGDFSVKRSNSGNVFDVTGDGVELSGFRVETAATGSGRCVDVSGADFVRVRKLQLDLSRGDGIRVINGSYCQVHDNILRDIGSGGAANGIHITSTGSGGLHNHVEDNRIYDTVGDGIQISNANSDHTIVRGNLVCDSSGWGIIIADGVTDAHVIDNFPANNTSGAISDSGTDTELHNNGHYATDTALALVQTDTDDIQSRLPGALVSGRMDSDVGAMQANVITASALAADAVAEIVDAVWRELLADHQAVSGSFAEAQMLIAGLVQNNYVLDSTTFHPISKVMTAGRMRIFSNGAQVTAATDGGSSEGELATFEVTSTLDVEDATKVDLYKVKKV